MLLSFLDVSSRKKRVMFHLNYDCSRFEITATLFDSTYYHDSQFVCVPDVSINLLT